MSRTREPSQKNAPYTGMTLPNIPRIAADEKSRQKYLSEYDKYEPELRRHHLGGVDTTNTIGLKDVPANFDRTVPSLFGPTEAELEYERARENRKHQTIRRGERAHAARGTSLSAAAMGPTDTAYPGPGTRRSMAPLPPTPSAATAAAIAAPADNAFNNASRPSSARAAGTAAAAAAASAGAEEGAATVTWGDADATSTPPANPSAAPGDPAAPPFTEATAATPSAAAAVTIVSPACMLRPPSTSPGRPARTAMSAPRARTAPSVKSPPPPAQRLGQRFGVSSATPRPPPGLMRSRPPPPPPPRPASVSPARPRTAVSTRRLANAEATARVLHVLLDPPPQYASALDLNLSFFDLSWLRNGEATPLNLTTLSNHSTDDAGFQAPRINSPRSVITMLEHGATPKDWDPVQSTASVAAMTAGREYAPDATAVQAEVREQRRAHVQAQREALRRRLQDSYAALCARANFNDVVTWYRRLRQADMLAETPLEEEDRVSLATAVLQRQERQRRVFETNKLRMMRQVQQAQEVLERQAVSEQRKAQAETEAEAERLRKAQEEQESRRMQQVRLEGHRLERQRREEAYRQQLEMRLAKAESRNAERAAARERQLQAAHQQREAQEAERLRRLQRNTAVLEEQAAAVEERRREKEAKAEETRTAREARLAREHRALAEKQLRAAQLRDEARQRAAEADEAAREAARVRQEQAELRLYDFYLRRQEEAAARAAVEAAHHERLNEVRAQALEREEQFRAAVEDSMAQHEQQHREARLRQVSEALWRRESDWEEQEAKAYAVLQQHRITEFNKLHNVVDLLEKRKAANAIMRQRQLVCEQAMRDREKLRMERDALKQHITSIAP